MSALPEQDFPQPPAWAVFPEVEVDPPAWAGSVGYWDKDGDEINRLVRRIAGGGRYIVEAVAVQQLDGSIGDISLELGDAMGRAMTAADIIELGAQIISLGAAVEDAGGALVGDGHTNPYRVPGAAQWGASDVETLIKYVRLVLGSGQGEVGPAAAL